LQACAVPQADSMRAVNAGARGEHMVWILLSIFFSSQQEGKISMLKPGKGQYAGMLGRDEFRLRFVRSFGNPTYDTVKDALDQVEEVAWAPGMRGRRQPRSDHHLW
jgi:hypothetical protein